ncbi:MAG: phosphoribosylformylglycinamidine synthase [Oscillospiraceae bacterium]|jgi:phosphoribosylformylglycinamidine synthase|nr:phosphoribosylformylglycinamidine synthase [Oscillospiraceae bacterium]
MSVFRCYTEKKPGFDVEARALAAEARDFLGIRHLERVRLFVWYDIEGVTPEEYGAARTAILSEPAIDDIYDEALPREAEECFRISVEALPGQYDQRADSCAQCIQMITRGEKPTVRAARTYVFHGKLSEADETALKRHLINPVETREVTSGKPETLRGTFPAPEPVRAVEGFISATDSELAELLGEYGLAMDLDDLKFMRAYFRDEERREPTVTELRLVDTYWSDHCRHTTFQTRLEDIKISDETVRAAFGRYLELRREVYGEGTERPVTLMDLGTIAAKALKKRGGLRNLDVSEEVNACSIHIDVEVDGKTEDWLLMFKNETHNHPTEIEPFGGAATCIGGAIRDPLSGRAYVYQAMRVTGAADPRAAVADTIPGKLPQRRLTTTAARGYSSYGNQIGLATGLVHEFYHPGYAAKRMEIGAVVGAVKFENVRRETPEAGDVVILLGGRTGRDGIGGATGSSKTHNASSLSTMASEVQKGNAPEERKIQRLFRDAEVTRLIKRCNDFGAGGVSVAIGELADGLDIDLSKVRKKYEGLGATELAISESQERMAVVVAARDAEAFIAKAAGENLEAYVVATVTKSPRMVLRFENAVVASLSREFLSSNGAAKHADVAVTELCWDAKWEAKNRREYYELGLASQAGLREMFDSSVGASTVLAPFGGRTQKTSPQVMAALLPVQSGETTTASVMAFGFDPFISEVNPYFGARTAVIVSLAKLVAAGADPDRAYLTFQEYFEKLRREPARWGKVFSALLGALDAQIGLETAAIGGKDSMSGSFGEAGAGEINVPPTLVSFAIAPADAREIVSPEFKAAGHDVVLFSANDDLTATKEMWRRVHGLIKSGVIVAAAAAEPYVLEVLYNMCFGNNIGFEAEADANTGFFGAVFAEVTRPVEGATVIGRTTAEPVFRYSKGNTKALAELLAEREGVLEGVFPTRAEPEGDAPVVSYEKRQVYVARESFARPRATVLSFPGTNSEIDTVRALERAGAAAETVVIRNLTAEMLRESVTQARRAIEGSQIVVLPGGFSGGDEPDGSAKFITAFFRNAEISDAAHGLLRARDGLMLGICNGFQALIKLGLVPFGEIVAPETNPYTLTYNVIGRHQARYVYTRVASVASPWMSKSDVGDVYAVPVSHGEGRFVAPEDGLERLIAGGQIAAQYCDIGGAPSMDIAVNPNGSRCAVEGIFSPDGRVFGKMGHSERRGGLVAKNIAGNRHQPVFESGVYYYK